VALDLPDDFRDFWHETVEEARSAPLDMHRAFRREAEHDTHHVETFSFRGIQGETVHGWIAVPDERYGRVPGFLWLAPYGQESVLPNQYGTRPGFVSLSFNFHGNEAFHQEKYTPRRGYFAHGADDPHEWVFRRMFQNAYLAARLLQAMTEVDETRLACMGMSQGAGISIWMGAWCPLIRAVVADMPFLGNVRETLGRAAYRYPLKELADFMEQIPLGKERVRETLRYFDTMHQASACYVPTQISLGEKDPAVRPENALAIYDALPGPKNLIRYDWGHDWHPDMVYNNLKWLLESLG
jgi:cephalosporin-C deacetylase